MLRPVRSPVEGPSLPGYRLIYRSILKSELRSISDPCRSVTSISRFESASKIPPRDRDRPPRTRFFLSFLIITLRVFSSLLSHLDASVVIDIFIRHVFIERTIAIKKISDARRRLLAPFATSNQAPFSLRQLPFSLRFQSLNRRSPPPPPPPLAAALSLILSLSFSLFLLLARSDVLHGAVSLVGDKTGRNKGGSVIRATSFCSADPKPGRVSTGRQPPTTRG